MRNNKTNCIHSCFHEVLDALLILHTHFVSLPTANTPIASRIFDDDKYYPFFEDCIGALDGTHIPMFVPAEDHAQYQNCKGFLSQNVLAACDFDMQFLYILASWDGSAYDGWVLQCNEAYQTPVTSNVRLISSQVTRKVSSVLLNYVLKVEQGLGLPDGDSRMCRSHYVSKGKVR